MISNTMLRNLRQMPLKTLRDNKLPAITSPFQFFQRHFFADNATSKDNNMIVTFEQVQMYTCDKNALIIDVREPDEIKEHGKIPNSINIPLGNVSQALGSLSDKEFEKMYNRQKPKEDSLIVFYCMIGRRSGMAYQNAVNLGFNNAKNYLGSWNEWASKKH